MPATACPVCFEGRIPIEFDFHPFSGELDCPYCNGLGTLDPENPDDARTLAHLEQVDPSDPEFQAQAAALAIARAKRIEETARADLHFEVCAARGGAAEREENAAAFKTRTSPPVPVWRT